LLRQQLAFAIRAAGEGAGAGATAARTAGK